MVATSQIRTVWPSPAAASQRPSGATATATTLLLWPHNTARSFLMAASQIRTVPS